MEKQEQIVFQMILHGGNGRSSAMEAILAAKQGDFSKAKEKLEESSEALNQAHKLQSSLIQAEVREEPTKVSLLMVHAQDHLMNAITVKDMATEFVSLYEEMKTKN